MVQAVSRAANNTSHHPSTALVSTDLRHYVPQKVLGFLKSAGKVNC
jgi:hypothetical protein